MAQKRMFDKNVVGSDKFLDLPNSSKALYFMAGMEADDKGFFQPRKLQRMCGFSDDDYKILIAKGFFITFESGVMVVTDWNKNNWLDSRRITETEYIDELNMLKMINNKYELANVDSSKCLADAKPSLRENRIEENRIEENRIEEKEENNICKTYDEDMNNICNSYEKHMENENEIENINKNINKNENNKKEEIVEIYNTICTNLSKVSKITDKRKKAICKFLKEFTLDDFRKICSIANNNDFLTGKNDRGWKADFDFLLREDKATSILEGKYKNNQENSTGNPFFDLLREEGKL